MTNSLLTDPANHPANGPLTVERITRLIAELRRSLEYQNGGDMAYVIADAIKGLEELLVSREVGMVNAANLQLHAVNASPVKGFAEKEARVLQAIPDCWCRTCRPVTMTDMRFVVCPNCGNKRCPHANDHRNACTGSNEPGQEGSAYPAAPQEVKS